MQELSDDDQLQLEHQQILKCELGQTTWLNMSVDTRNKTKYPAGKWRKIALMTEISGNVAD